MVLSKSLQGNSEPQYWGRLDVVPSHSSRFPPKMFNEDEAAMLTA